MPSTETHSFDHLVDGGEERFFAVVPVLVVSVRSAAATVSPELALSPTAGACGNHGPIVRAPVAPYIAAPVRAEIVVRIAIFRMQDGWRRRIPIHGMGPDVRLVTNRVGK